MLDSGELETLPDGYTEHPGFTPRVIACFGVVDLFSVEVGVSNGPLSCSSFDRKGKVNDMFMFPIVCSAGGNVGLRPRLVTEN